jgi:hypothetical protein
MKAFYFLAVLLFSGTALSQTGTTGVATGSTTMVSYSNYFNKAVQGTTRNELTIYVGRTATGCTTTNENTPCNSCAQLASTPITGTMVCNTSEVHPDLLFTVALASSSAAAYVNCPDGAILMHESGSTTNFKGPKAGTQTPSSGAAVGTTVQASFRWSDIFSALGVTGTDSFTKTLEFGFANSCSTSSVVDVGLKVRIVYRYVAATLTKMTFPCDGNAVKPGPYEGICSFQASRGDEKVFLKNIGAPERTSSAVGLYVPSTNTSPGLQQDASGMVYDKLRIFCKPGNGSPHTTTTNDVCADLQIDGANLNNPRITGLANGVQYEFLAANVDEGGNVTYFSDPLDVGALGVARPEPVNGLLDGKNCFIATAAFGSSMAPEVERFRSFRDQVLLKSSWGRTFVEFYYEYSPEAARFIANHELLRTITRLFLYPILGFCELILKFGFLIPFFGLIFIFGVFRAQKKGFRREKI